MGLLQSQFADLLRFLKVDRGLNSSGRLLWRCDLCGLETTGQGIHSHRQMHCREYGYLIDRENDGLRSQFEKKLEPYSARIAEFCQNALQVGQIGWGDLSGRPKIINLLQNSGLPRDLWVHAVVRIARIFSGNAYDAFIREMPSLAGAEQVAPPEDIGKTYENILKRIDKHNTVGTDCINVRRSESENF